MERSPYCHNYDACMNVMVKVLFWPVKPWNQIWATNVKSHISSKIQFIQRHYLFIPCLILAEISQQKLVRM
jgi:hypothetical protein